MSGNQIRRRGPNFCGHRAVTGGHGCREDQGPQAWSHAYGKALQNHLGQAWSTTRRSPRRSRSAS